MDIIVLLNTIVMIYSGNILRFADMDSMDIQKNHIMIQGYTHFRKP